MTEIKSDNTTLKVNKLAATELAYLKQVASGKSQEEIADLNGISENQVYKAMKKIRLRSGFKTLNQLIIASSLNGQLDLGELVNLPTITPDPLSKRQRESLLFSARGYRVPEDENASINVQTMHSHLSIAKTKLLTSSEVVAVLRGIKLGEVSETEVRVALLAFDSSSWNSLTLQEQSFIREIAMGNSYKIIAPRLDINFESVGYLADNLRARLNVLTNHQAVMKFTLEQKLNPFDFTDHLNIPGFDTVNNIKKRLLNTLIVDTGKIYWDKDIAKRIDRDESRISHLLAELHQTIGSLSRTQLALGYISAGLYEIVEPTIAMQPYIDIWKDVVAA